MLPEEQLAGRGLQLSKKKANNSVDMNELVDGEELEKLPVWLV